MSNNTQKLQGQRVLSVIPSDTIDVISPAYADTTGTTTGTTASKLVDSTKSFNYNNVKIGDIVRNDTDSTLATVTAVDDANTLSLSADIMASGESYRIFKKDGSKGAVIYVGATGDVAVETVSNDRETFVGVVGGSFLPIMVSKVLVTGTTATSILAIW